MRGDIKSNIQLFNICLTKDHLYPRLYAREGHSTTDTLNYILQAIHEATDSGNCGARMFFADYSKGFDLIDHSILLRDLAFFDIDTILINWIRAFLIGRSQAVRIANSLSDWKSPRGGILQGTKLGVVNFMQNDNFTTRPIVLGNNTVECVTTYKLLGIIISNDLKWHEHIDYISKKASKRLYSLKIL